MQEMHMEWGWYYFTVVGEETKVVLLYFAREIYETAADRKLQIPKATNSTLKCEEKKLKKKA